MKKRGMKMRMNKKRMRRKRKKRKRRLEIVTRRQSLSKLSYVSHKRSSRIANK